MGSKGLFLIGATVGRCLSGRRLVQVSNGAQFSTPGGGNGRVRKRTLLGGNRGRQEPRGLQMNNGFASWFGAPNSVRISHHLCK